MSVEGFAYVIAVLVAATFVAAAVAKLRSRVAVVEDFAAMGLVAPEALSVAVPIAEFAVAALLIGAPRIGGFASLLVLVVFTVVLARLMAAGTGVACRCFGAAASEPVSGVELVRNALLIVASLIGTYAVRTVPSVSDLVVGLALFGVGFGAVHQLRLARAH